MNLDVCEMEDLVADPWGLTRAKVQYASAMQGAGRLLARTNLIGDEPPPISQRRRHWLYSLTGIHDSVQLARLEVPWWTYSAIDAVTLWLSARTSPVRVFEYGSGASTLWLSKRAGQVHSVEHDVPFGEIMAEQLAPIGNVELQVIAPVPAAHPTVASDKPGYAGMDFSDYVRAIDAVDGHFDVVVIDGRVRSACLQAAVPRLAGNALVIFDNSARRRYRAGIQAAPLSERIYRGLTPTLPYPEQTSLLLTP